MKVKPSSKYEKKYLFKISNINQLEDILTNGISPDLDRKSKRIPNAYNIRDYVHLSMNIKSKNNHDLCILCINKEVLDLKGTIITDRDTNRVLVHYYTVEEALEHTLEKSSEVLTYGFLDSKYIIGILVASEEIKDEILASNKEVKILVKPELFIE